MRRSRILPILFLLVVFGLVHFALSHWYREVVMRDGVPERTLRQFDAVDPASIHTLALGDSHVKRGIQPRALEGSFNFALPGERYPEMLYRLQSLLAAGLSVDTVVLQAEPHLVAERPDPHRAFAHYYAGFVDYPKLGWERGEPLPYLARWLTGRYAPYAGQRGNVLRFLDTGAVPELPWTLYVPMEGGALRGQQVLKARSTSELEKLATDRVRVHFPASPTDPEAFSDLRKLLEFCHQRGIRVLLVQFPTTDAYRAALAKVVDVSDFDARVNELAAEFDNVRVLDLRDRFSGPSNLHLFGDVDHLSSEGADRTSIRVGRELSGWSRLSGGS